MNEEKDWSCFVAVPPSAAFAQVREAILETLAASDVQALEARDFSRELPIEVIRRADFLIADVSDASPYIFYEVGMANALRKPVQLIAQRTPQSPADLAGHQLVMYGAEETDKLRDFLRYWLCGTLESITSRTYTRAL
jgi:nucleoside 2-deoxyribosyltransferase